MDSLGVSIAIDQIDKTFDTAPQQPGSVAMASDGKEYRLVKNNATTTATSGYPCLYANSDPHDNEYLVSPDLSVYPEGAFAGVFVVDVDPSEYAYILKDGVYESCTVWQTVTATGALLLANTNTDGYFLPAGANNVMGYAGVAMATSDNTQSWTCPIWIKGL